MLNLLRLMPVSDITKCRSPKKRQKTAKIRFFSPPQDERINRSRRNFAGRRVPRVSYSLPNLAFIGKRGSVQEPPKLSKFAQNCGWFLATGSRQNKHIQMKFGPWVCSSTPNLALIAKRGSVREPPPKKKYQNLPKIVVFGHRKPTQ